MASDYTTHPSRFVEFHPVSAEIRKAQIPVCPSRPQTQERTDLK
jgi:hypothetical protein